MEFKLQFWKLLHVLIYKNHYRILMVILENLNPKYNNILIIRGFKFSGGSVEQAERIFEEAGKNIEV